MADDVTLPGTGDIVAADDASGKKVQLFKLTYGADGSRVHATVDADGVLVNLGTNNDVTVTGTVAVSAAALPLPSGAATSAKQDTEIASLASLDTKTPALGQALAAASVPVVLTAAQLTTLTPPAAIAGFATSAKQDTGNTSLASIDGKITAVNTGAVVVASSALPSGAATSAKQDTGNTSLSSIDGKITAVNTGAVVVASSALPSGAATLAEQQTQTTSLQLIDDAVATTASAITAKGLAIVGTDGTNARVLKTDTSGELQIDVLTMPTTTVTGTVAATQSGAWNVTNISGTISLPTGASTLAEQQTQSTSLSTIAAKDFATQTTLALIKAKTDNIDVALSTRTKPADQQHVIVDSSATVAVTNANLDSPISGILTELQQKLEAADIATLATSAKQDTGNATLATIDSKITAVDTGAVVVASSVLPANAAQETGGNLDTLVTQTAPLTYAQSVDATSLVGPMVQGIVSDTPNSFTTGQLQPISLTSEGRVRVAAVLVDAGRVWQHAFDDPWGTSTNPWAQESW